MDKGKEWKQTPASSGGVPLKKLNAITITIACVLALCLVYVVFRTTNSYGVMRDATERYIASQQDASNLMDGSDYLTDQAREFVVTGKTECVDNFFEELNTTCRRDKAVEDLGLYFSDTEAYRFLQDALERSNTLVETEYRAMRLVIEAKGYDLSRFPKELAQLELTAEDASLSPGKKSALASELVFGDAYRQAKEQIRSDVEMCLDTLMAETKAQQTASSDKLLSLLREQSILIIVLFISVFVLVLLTSRLVIRPLERSVAHISGQQTMPMTGAAELRFLAAAYNAMFEQNRRDQDQLSYDAAHDDLTDLYNRGVFDRMRESSDTKNIALMLVDVDEFKSVNDRYGHDVGDRVLKKVAGLLQSSFRSEDYVCRIGGDEFAVIMVRSSSEMKTLVYRKMQGLNDILKNPDDGLPPVSLSVGVAFGDRENPTDDIYKDADTALYRVKKAGRGDCAFY